MPDSEPSSRLESLSLVLLTEENQESVALTSTIFRDTARVRRLALIGISIQFDSSLFAGLTALVLHAPRGDFMTTTELLDLLENMPDLETLHIGNYAFRTTSGDHHIVNLLRLSSLSFFGTYKRASNIPEFLKALKYISYPPSADMRITGIYPEEEVCLLLEALHINDTCHIRTLKLGTLALSDERLSGVDTDGKGLCLQISEDTNGQPLSSTKTIILQWRFLKTTIDMVARQDPTTHLLQKLPLSELHTIRLEDNISSRLWLPVLGNLNQVRHIYTRAFNIVIALAEKLDGKKNNINHIYFPALEHLVLQGIDFTSIKFDILRGSLDNRSELGAPIKHISFFDCKGLSWKIGSLLEIGVHVEIESKLDN